MQTRPVTKNGENERKTYKKKNGKNYNFEKHLGKRFKKMQKISRRHTDTQPKQKQA